MNMDSDVCVAITEGSENKQRLTADGLIVPEDMVLKFLATATYLGWSGNIASLAVEFQQDENRRRPYLILDMGPFHIQIGWLWT